MYIVDTVYMYVNKKSPYNYNDKLEKPCLLNCPLQCINTLKSQYYIAILNGYTNTYHTSLVVSLN